MAREFIIDGGATSSPLSRKSTCIWVRFQREGIHRYPEAGTNPSLADVSYLQYPHRHIFHFEVGVPVTHDNRQIEFIQFKHFLEGLYDTGVLDLDYKSCEMIANDIIDRVVERYEVDSVICSVSEDNENGATVNWERV